jgi:hypothetical protein
MFETANTLLTTITGVKRATLVSRYMQLYDAFLPPAILQHIGTLKIPYTSSAKYYMYFFMTQPVAITVEDFTLYSGKKGGLRKNKKTNVIGHAWVGASTGFGPRHAIKFCFDIGLDGSRHPGVATSSVMDRVLG